MSLAIFLLFIVLLFAFMVWELSFIWSCELSFSAKMVKRYIVIEDKGKFYPKQQNSFCFIPIKDFHYIQTGNSSYNSVAEAKNCIDEHHLWLLAQKKITRQEKPKYHSYQKAKSKPEVKQ